MSKDKPEPKLHIFDRYIETCIEDAIMDRDLLKFSEDYHIREYLKDEYYGAVYPLAYSPADQELQTKTKRKQNWDNRAKYYPELKTLIEQLGEWDVNIRELARKWGVPKSTVQNWKQDICDEIGVIELDKFGRNVQVTGLANIKRCQRMIRKADTVKEHAIAQRAYNETLKAFTEFMESYGYKVKVAEKHEVVGAPVTFQILSDDDKYPDFSKEKSKKGNNKKLQTRKQKAA